jgi:hypothetical protein
MPWLFGMSVGTSPAACGLEVRSPCFCFVLRMQLTGPKPSDPTVSTLL